MQQRKLPPLPAGSSSIRGGIYYILVDPSLSSHYKVVVFSPLLAKKGTLTHLYDSETHNWNIGCQYKESVSTFCYGVYFNGSIYFLRLGVFSSYRLDPHGNLSRVANPIGIYTLSMQNQNFVTESNGALFFLALYIKKGIKCKLRVWEIKENGNKWNIVCKTNLQPVLDACGVGGYIVRSVGMGIIKGEELILPLPGKKIVICRLYDKGFELQDHNGQEFLQADKPEDLHRFFIQTLAPV